MYSFTSKPPASSGIKLQNTGALPLKVVIIDSTGTPLTHVDDIAPATEGGIDSWQPPADGTYFVVIYPTEALNNLIKRIKRIGFGFTNFRNYRVRALLYAGKPNWRVLGSIVVR